MEEPNVEAVLEEMAKHQEIALPIHENQWIVHISVENLLPSRTMSMLGRLRLKLFSFLRQTIAARPLFLWAGR